MASNVLQLCGFGIGRCEWVGPGQPENREKKQTTTEMDNRWKPNYSTLTVSSIIKVSSEHFPIFQCGPDRRAHTQHTLRNPARKKNLLFII